MGVIPNKKMEENKRMTIKTEEGNIELTEDQAFYLKALKDTEKDPVIHLALICGLFAVTEKCSPDLFDADFARSSLSEYNKGDFEKVVKHLTLVVEDIEQGKATIKTKIPKETLIETYNDTICFINWFYLNKEQATA